MGEDRIEIDVTRTQAETILASLKHRAAMTKGLVHEDSIETYNIVKHQIESQ